MAQESFFTASDLPPYPHTLESARTADEYIGAFRYANTVVSTPEQWISFMDALHESEFTSTHALGKTDWIMHELEPAPPDNSPHKLRLLRHIESENEFVPRSRIALVSLLHKHERKLTISMRNGKTPEAPITYALATQVVLSSTLESEGVFQQFDRYMKTYRFASEIATSSIYRLDDALAK